MNMRRFLSAAMVLLALSMAVPTQAGKQIHTFEVGDGQFLLDGKPFVIKAAEIHYLRIPHQYWEHRIKMCKALGMNTMCAYVFWNIHEQRPGQYDFTGDRDLARFVSLCQKHGMWVIVRPGPYSCAEWEMGGIPWWLLKEKGIQLRSADPKFLEPALRFERRVAEELAPYRLENGGNIIMVQVENEFGSYGTDKAYLSALRDAFHEIGWKNTPLFQCDWSSNFKNNALDDLIWTLNFGTNADVVAQFKEMRALRPTTPLMCSEYWSGWFDGWGQPHQRRSSDAMVKGIDTMLGNGISFSLYMTHGGTSFGQWAGANNNGYVPDCTSYDYDAPIDEQGAPTEKYFKLRKVMQKYSTSRLPTPPKALPVVSFPQIELTSFAPLMAAENLPAPIASDTIASMEQFDQGYGSIIYSCQLPEVKAGSLLRMTEPCDYIRIYADGNYIGHLYRGKGYQNAIHLPALPKGARLDIFVEAMGRINFSKLIHDPKGITERVELLSTTDEGHQITYDLRNWQVRLLPVSTEFVSSRQYADTPSARGEGYYRGTFVLKKTGDTYIDMSTWGKGLVWVNGHCLGRFWQVGPQQALFLPGCWLKKGRNEIIVMDVIGPSSPVLSGLDHPIIDQLRKELMPHDGFRYAPRKGNAPLPKASAGNDAAPGARQE